MVAGEEAGERRSYVLSKAFREAEPFLRSLAIRLCRHASDANDLVQDTFERALRAGSEEPLRNPRAWLATILHNLFVDRCRALARRPPHEPLQERHAVIAIDPADDPRPAWSRMTIADVRAALEHIEPDFRRVYQMHVFEHRSYEEIAATLRIQRVTVGTRLNRARHQLRAVLCERLGEESQS
ncbi:MAG TPA: RNA polymerase sigma factor [Kofleriaceae bacterium]|nr:RNA polymerase sigma factor [Kofleriaceae bacterium]